MEENPNKRQPSDPVQYPGKMDHTTACCFVVGRKEELSMGQEDLEVQHLVTKQEDTDTTKSGKDEVDSRPDKKKQKSADNLLANSLNSAPASKGSESPKKPSVTTKVRDAGS